jgi:hypothetical protein
VTSRTDLRLFGLYNVTSDRPDLLKKARTKAPFKIDLRDSSSSRKELMASLVLPKALRVVGLPCRKPLTRDQDPHACGPPKSVRAIEPRPSERPGTKDP